MRWPGFADFVHLDPVADPLTWTRPGLVQFFNLACVDPCWPGCVPCGIPFMKRLHAEFGGSVNLVAIHTSRGHRLYPHGQVEPQLIHFARDYARLPFPVALDLDGSVAEHWQTDTDSG